MVSAAIAGETPASERDRLSVAVAVPATLNLSPNSVLGRRIARRAPGRKPQPKDQESLF
jgi:hypothetical protein